MKQNRLTRYREQTCSCQVGAGEGGKGWEFGISRGKLLYKEWINNKVLLLNKVLQHKELYSTSCDKP